MTSLVNPVSLSGLGVDVSTAISKTIDTAYVATRNCWCFHNQNANNNGIFLVDGVAVSVSNYHPGITGAKGSALVFVSKGQTYQATGGYSLTEFGIMD